MSANENLKQQSIELEKIKQTEVKTRQSIRKDIGELRKRVDKIIKFFHYNDLIIFAFINTFFTTI